jgi:serine protease Do
MVVAGGILPSAQSVPANPLDAVVGVHATIPPDARTAATLGTERTGSGIVIDDEGLILTIGYLILEADRVDILVPGNNTVPAEFVAYDYDSGFGLVRAAQALNIAPIRLGFSGGSVKYCHAISPNGIHHL